MSGQFSLPVFVASHWCFQLGTLTSGIGLGARGHGRWAMDIGPGRLDPGYRASRLGFGDLEPRPSGLRPLALK